MKSFTTKKFWDCYRKLPQEIQKRTKEAYELFTQDHQHPGLRFKKILNDPFVYSVRVTQDYRALGVRKEKAIIWFWIGSHSDYEKLIKQL